MKTYIFILGFIFTISFANGQKIDYSDDLIKQLENPKYSDDSLTKDNLIEKFVRYDFSPLFIPRYDFLGYIGKDYKRIKIYFTSISKDKVNNKLYQVKGKSIIEKTSCDFDGTITITQIRELKKMHFGLDEEYKDSGITTQGVLMGSYDLKENPNQEYSGIFHGNMTLWWYLDKSGKIHFDDIENYSDSYRNNEYAGTWKSYSSGLEKTCNWGEFRIPFSNDLDIGAGEFSPNPKYLDKGWKDLEIK
jgi:hypothetical protein